jgi:hypothetical protein
MNECMDEQKKKGNAVVEKGMRQIDIAQSLERV